jgi:hypothetical protein
MMAQGGGWWGLVLKALNSEKLKAKPSAPIIAIVCHGLDFKQGHDADKQTRCVCILECGWAQSFEAQPRKLFSRKAFMNEILRGTHEGCCRRIQYRVQWPMALDTVF